MKSVRAQQGLLRLPLRSAEARIPSRFRWQGRAEQLAVALAFLLALAPLPLVARVLGSVVVAALVIAASMQTRPPDAARGWIVVDPSAVSREREGATTRLFAWAQRFGIAVLSNESKNRGLLAITTPDQTRYVPVSVSGEEDERVARDLFARVPTLADADVAPREADEALSPEDARRLLAAVRARDAGALERILLSDLGGAPIALDAKELRAGGRVIDLTAPLEWRSFLFLESAGPTGAVVQATWVRQAGVEVVLVAPQADTRDSFPRGGSRASIPDAPPPPEQRVAIERLFMAPVRHALARAPRVSRAPAPTSSPRSEGRAPT